MHYDGSTVRILCWFCLDTIRISAMHLSRSATAKQLRQPTFELYVYKTIYNKRIYKNDVNDFIPEVSVPFSMSSYSYLEK